jgi:hypothetical protein
MLAIVLAALIAAAPQSDTVFTSDGGRVRGTVVEESAKGVTVQLVDGTTRTFEPGQVIRIEYSDGTVSTPKPPAPPPAVAPAPPPAAAQPPPAAAPGPASSGAPDTLYFADGGRGRGLVIEETPTGGVTVRMGDGTVRRYPPGQVIRIEYGDGTISVPRSRQPYAYPPAPPPPPRPLGPPPAPPAQPAQPAKPPGMPPASPFYLSLGLGGSFLGGEAEDGFKMDDIFQPQVDVLVEAGLRLSPAVALGVYLDIGAGDISTQDPIVGAWCVTESSCGAANFRLGALIRHTWDPYARTTPWLAIGTGWESGGVYLDDADETNVVWYEGWEMLRLMGGVDLRSNPVFGIGLYAAVSFGSYSDAEYLDPVGATMVKYEIDDRTFHTSVSAGLRFTLFP